MISKIKQTIFGRRAESIDSAAPNPNFNTTEPSDRLDFYQWAKELRVSSLHQVNQHVYLTV